MRYTLNRLTHTIAGFTLTAGLAMASDLVQCPAQVDVRQQIAAPVQGWSTSLEDMPHWLAGITFFDGKPADKASLAPDRESKLNGKVTATWNFAVSDRLVWVACRYAWTTVTLTRELPKQVRSCSVTYTPGQSVAGLPAIEKVDCK